MGRDSLRMNLIDKTQKQVLVVDDHQGFCHSLTAHFVHRSSMDDCPYKFQVETANSAVECIHKLRTGREYDVVVLDVVLIPDVKQGLELNLALALAEEHGPEHPVRIIVTFEPRLEDCVEALRAGAWDYIEKKAVNGRSAQQVIIDSALARLRLLDLREEQAETLAGDWIPSHFADLQKEHGGQLVALWHKPEVKVIAHGADAFELEQTLAPWRKEHAIWEQPYILEVPADRDRAIKNQEG